MSLTSQRFSGSMVRRTKQWRLTVAGDKVYKRILLKLSGEALTGEEAFGIDPKILDQLALEIGQLVGIGVQVGLVVGGGNLFRGKALQAAGLDRVTGDHMGMLATVMNALALRDALSSGPILRHRLCRLFP